MLPILIRRFLNLAAFIALSFPTVRAQQSAWGDQGDGTFKNPILPGDFSDPDVIRVGEDYYLITSTFQYSPGMAVLRSQDMVNWKYAGHCIPDVTQIGPEMNWDRMGRYGTGVYAGALRQHAGKFWMFMTTLQEGIFMTTADQPEGPWAPLYRISNRLGYDDPCPFWDDDGQAYIVMSRPTNRDPGEKWCTTLYRMSPDGKSIDFSSAQVIVNPSNPAEDNGREANKIFKRNGYYYIQHNGAGYGSVTRSQNIWGPYEEQRITPTSQQTGTVDANQGAFIDTPSGDWYFLTQEGAGKYFGRQCHLIPITWVNDWPVGTPVRGSGSNPTIIQKPIANMPVTVPQTDEEFSAPDFGFQWEWNYQPRAGFWSLSERPGFLRLKAWPALTAETFSKAGNTLSQRLIGQQGGEVLTKMELAGMADGQTAGLCVYWLRQSYSTFGVVQAGGTRTIQLNINGTKTAGPVLAPSTTSVWLKASIDGQAFSTFSFSLDGVNFTPLPGRYSFGWNDYRGTRFGLYTYNDAGTAGTADFDFFRYKYAGPLVGAAPTGISAAGGDRRINVTWTAASGATGYRVTRASAGGSAVTVAANTTGTTFIDTGLTNETTYYYTVTALYPSGAGVESTPATAAPSGPILPIKHWKFDETTGTSAADASGSGATGTLVNGATWTTGKIGNAVNLAASGSQSVTLPTGIVSGLTQCTISAWVLPTSVSTWARVLDFGTGTTNYLALTARATSGTGPVRFMIRTSSVAEQQINGTSALPAGVWSHVAVTLANGVGILYVNGVEVGRNSAMTLTPASLGSTTLNYLGKSQFNDPAFNGKIDDLRIYNKALSAQALATLQPPVAQWKFDETSGTSAGDTSGNGRAATLFNAPTWAAGRLNNAVVLNGTNQYLNAPTGLLDAVTDFTIATWVRMDGTATWPRIFDFGTGTTKYMSLTGKSNGGGLRFAITNSGNSAEQRLDGPALPVGTWTHVAVTLEGTLGILYINGVEVARNTAMTLNPASLGSTTLNYLGRSQYSSDPYLQGSLDEFVIYRYALAPSELAALVPPKYPYNLTATPGNAQVTLTWGLVDGATTYQILRGTTTGNYVPIGSPTSDLTYTDSSAVNGTPYFYAVTAQNILGSSSAATPATSITPMNAATQKVPAITMLPEAATLQLNVPSVTGWQYHLEASDTLQSNSWTEISSQPGTGADLQFNVSRNPNERQRFFRIILKP